MEDANLVEKHDCDATTFAFADFGSKSAQECFDVLPGDVRAAWVCEDGFQCLLVRALHACMVPDFSTERKAGAF